MPQYSYNNIIIIVTNVIMLELMSARIIYTQVFFYHFIFFNVSQNIRTTKTSKLLINFFFLTTMTSELSKYLKEQLSVFVRPCKCETTQMKLATNIKKGFLIKSLFACVM